LVLFLPDAAPLLAGLYVFAWQHLFTDARQLLVVDLERG